MRKVCLLLAVGVLCLTQTYGEEGRGGLQSHKDGVVHLGGFSLVINDSIEPPIMYPEPSFTQGNSNTVYWSSNYDTFFVQYDTTYSFDSPTTSPPVSDTFWTPGNELVNGQTYWYRVLAKSGSEASRWSDSTSSTQDTFSPTIDSVRIPEANPLGWCNDDTIHVYFTASDTAGIDSVYLYSRMCGATWPNVADTCEGYWLCTTGDPGPTSVIDTFTIVADSNGCYEFYIGAKDAAHAPESHEGYWVCDGNEKVPVSSDTAHCRINIDTTPPESVSLSGKQDRNTIQLQWTPSVDPEPGIGLWGYYVLRNSELIDSVYNDITYTDTTFDRATPDTFGYQILPFDSLGNTQKEGGIDTVFYEPPETTIVMYLEPEYTAGTSNTMYWKHLNSTDYYITQCDTDSSFPSPRESTAVDTLCAFDNLQDGMKYFYRVKQKDVFGRETPWSNIVWSIQDTLSPEVTDVRILEADSAGWYNGWYDSSIIRISFKASDSTGIDSIILYKRQDSVSDWDIFKQRDYPDSLTEVCDTFFLDSLSDGYHEFYIGAKDAAHAPESHEGHWIIDGNEDVPETSDTAHCRIKIDITPPDSVSSSCQQIEDSIRLEWTPSTDSGIGLWGYYVLRNRGIIDSVYDRTTYMDSLFDPTRPHTFVYQIQPFDSLRNIQKEGGYDTVPYEPPETSVVMYSEPEYTAGISNKVYWEHLNSTDYYIAQRDTDSSFPSPRECTTEVDTDTFCTFDSLQDGMKYFYRVKQKDIFGRETPWSNIVWSIQDATPPRLDSMWVITEGEWVYDRDIKVHLRAHDASLGKIYGCEIVETCISGTYTKIIDFEHHKDSIDTTVDYTSVCPIRTPIEIRLHVFDGAGNQSNTQLDTILLETIEDEIVGFPNPFDPNKQEMHIRVKDQKVGKIRIYDPFGNLVRVLRDKSGPHDFTWDGRNGRRELVANGGYLVVAKGIKPYKIAVLKK